MKRSRKVRYRRAKWLVGYWCGDALVWENYAHGPDTGAGGDPMAGVILDFFGRWRTVEELCAAFPDYSPSSLRKTVRALAQNKLLDQSDRPSSSNTKAMKHWQPWNPAAGFLHFSSRDVNFIGDPERVVRFLTRVAKTHPPPRPVKRYPGKAGIRLPKPRVDGEFVRVLKDRRTWREFGARAVRLEELSTMLHLSWGVQKWLRGTVHGKLALKTSASGGALHPIEAYVLARRIEGLAPGWYHYASDRHRLERLRRGATPAQVQNYLKGQWWFRDASALVAMTAVWERSQWKYRFSRAYRVVLADAGHVCQTFCLAATWLGLAPFSTMALADTKIEQDLGLNKFEESVLYVAGVGARPEHGEWTAWPRIRRRPRD